MSEGPLCYFPSHSFPWFSSAFRIKSKLLQNTLHDLIPVTSLISLPPASRHLTYSALGKQLFLQLLQCSKLIPISGPLHLLFFAPCFSRGCLFPRIQVSALMSPPLTYLFCPVPMCMHAKSLQSCLTLGDLTACSPPGSSVHGILQAGILEWIAMHSSRGSAQARDQT